MELDISTQIIIAIAIFITPFAIYQELKDRKLLKEAYEKLGLLSSNSQEFFSQFPISDFHILNKQGFFRLNSKFIISSDGSFGSFMHVGSEGGNSATRQSVYVFKPNVKSPSFYIRPTKLTDKAKSIAGYNDINFEDHPEFSKNYYLQSPENLDAFKKHFKDKYLKLFLENKYIWLESNGHTIAFFHEGSFAWRPNQLEESIQDFKKIRAVFDNK